MQPFTNYSAYTALQNHYENENFTLKDLFKNEISRFENFSLKFDDILFDFSKNLINSKTFELLINLANESNVKEYSKKMFLGEKINYTENRAVLHTALRDKSDSDIIFDGRNISKDISAVLEKIKLFTEKIHKGEHTGYTGKKINTIVNIGIGGSDLGPRMVCQALKPYAVSGMNIYFVSNVDGTDISETLDSINFETTLFIIASKTFSTQETLTNANTAKSRFLDNAHYDDIKRHFIALSTNKKAVTEFGISPDNIFEFWDWVGGRFSMWSAIGMSIALFLGYENFNKLLLGAYKADVHFREAPPEKNIPVIMALIAVWYNNFYNFPSQAVIPYDEYLSTFPAYLQQLDMESNGKSIDHNGNKVEYNTGNILWGTAGTNAQHSFFQLIHQGTKIIPVDFIAPVNSHNNTGNHHNILMSNMIAQSEALMKGKTKTEAMDELLLSGMPEKEAQTLVPYKVFEGNRPSNIFLLDKITPESLGKLIAFYEHKVFVQGVIWRINSFDQWGVELGKQLAKKILPELESDDIVSSHDSSTNSIINYYKKMKN